MWTANQWRHVVLSAESRFCLDLTMVVDGSGDIMQRGLLIVLLQNLQDTSPMIWAAIWTGGRTDLGGYAKDYFIESTFNFGILNIFISKFKKKI
jgi:hypothetical protein